MLRNHVTPAKLLLRAFLANKRRSAMTSVRHVRLTKAESEARPSKGTLTLPSLCITVQAEYLMGTWDLCPQNNEQHKKDSTLLSDQSLPLGTRPSTLRAWEVIALVRAIPKIGNGDRNSHRAIMMRKPKIHTILLHSAHIQTFHSDSSQDLTLRPWCKHIMLVSFFSRPVVVHCMCT